MKLSLSDEKIYSFLETGLFWYCRYWRKNCLREERDINVEINFQDTRMNEPIYRISMRMSDRWLGDQKFSLYSHIKREAIRQRYERLQQSSCDNLPSITTRTQNGSFDSMTISTTCLYKGSQSSSRTYTQKLIDDICRHCKVASAIYYLSNRLSPQLLISVCWKAH